MIEPIETKYENNRTIRTYDYGGYLAYISTYPSPYNDDEECISAEIKGNYNKNIVYPIISFNEATNKFEGHFNSFFTLKDETEQQWNKGIANALDFIREMNQVVKSLLIQYDIAMDKNIREI